MVHYLRYILAPQKKYYILERPHNLSWRGMRKYYEVLPIVGIVSLLLGTASLYFSLYYIWTRTDVAYTRTPGYRKVALECPPRAKLFDINDYKTYVPSLDLANTLREMYCEEFNRFCQSGTDCTIQIDWFNRRNLPYDESSCKTAKDVIHDEDSEENKKEITTNDETKSTLLLPEVSSKQIVAKSVPVPEPKPAPIVAKAAPKQKCGQVVEHKPDEVQEKVPEKTKKQICCCPPPPPKDKSESESKAE